MNSRAIIDLRSKNISFHEIPDILENIKKYDNCGILIFDMSGCEYITSGVIGIIIEKSRKKECYVIINTTKLYNLFQRLNIEEFIPIYKTIDEVIPLCTT